MGAVDLGLVGLAGEGGQHTAVVHVVAVVCLVPIGLHHGAVVAPELAAIVLGQLDAGDLGDRVRLVGGLERTRQPGFLVNWLGAIARIDAAGAEEHQALHTGQVCAVGLFSRRKSNTAFWSYSSSSARVRVTRRYRLSARRRRTGALSTSRRWPVTNMEAWLSVKALASLRGATRVSHRF